MKYKLTKDQMKDIRDEFLVLDNEELEYVCNTDEYMDDNGKGKTRIFQRKSDGKYFAVDLYWARYGYEDYGFETDYCDCEAYEVEKKQVMVENWIAVE